MAHLAIIAGSVAGLGLPTHQLLSDNKADKEADKEEEIMERKTHRRHVRYQQHHAANQQQHAVVMQSNWTAIQGGRWLPNRELELGPHGARWGVNTGNEAFEHRDTQSAHPQWQWMDVEGQVLDDSGRVLAGTGWVQAPVSPTQQASPKRPGSHRQGGSAESSWSNSRDVHLMPENRQEEARLIHKATVASLRDEANRAKQAKNRRVKAPPKVDRSTHDNTSWYQASPPKQTFSTRKQNQDPPLAGGFLDDVDTSKAQEDEEFNQTQRALYNSVREHQETYQPIHKKVYVQEPTSQKSQGQGNQERRPQKSASAKSGHAKSSGPATMSGALGDASTLREISTQEQKFANLARQNEVNLREAVAMAKWLPLGHHDRPSDSIIHEMEMMAECKSEILTAAPLDPSDSYTWLATVKGPRMTPYEGGLFTLELKMPDNYPQEFLSMKVLTQIFHQDINSNGFPSPRLFNEWASHGSLQVLLLGFHQLLKKPLSGRPMREDIAELRNKNRQMHNDIVKTYTEKYAT